MRNIDAPPAGWYPDPAGRTHLRWWDGLDWSDIWRAPPSNAELRVAEENREFFERANAPVAPIQRGGGVSQQDASQIIAEVRSVAREEVDRAAQEFTNRATIAVRSVTPLISEYASDLKKWVSRIVIVGIVLLVAYFVFQVVVQASFFDWLGDRIDNVTDESSVAEWVRPTPLRVT
jgi:hypothetical protein